MQRADSLENTLMLGKIEDKRRRGQQRMRCLYGITDSMNYEFEQTERYEGQEAYSAAVPGVTKSQTQFSD